MKSESLADLLARQQRSGEPYLEFLREESMSIGLYVLGPGAIDQQQPHTEDEVYVVVAGRSRFTARDQTRDVEPGDTIFVPAHLAHRFHDIKEELRVVVVFAPPEGARET